MSEAERFFPSVTFIGGELFSLDLHSPTFFLSAAVVPSSQKHCRFSWQGDQLPSSCTPLSSIFILKRKILLEKNIQQNVKRLNEICTFLQWRCWTSERTFKEVLCTKRQTMHGQVGKRVLLGRWCTWSKSMTREHWPLFKSSKFKETDAKPSFPPYTMV